ncbi:hypothetical protein M9H77_03086 [Catharanthus roseus]|uniref:Uncharacterized protein n=1 Tax=Catharanthus roseus TaxID=4058 RepID=A0ACC0CAP0_CATRO|nr:hypothetical protein M9H77_03086 [Catharanthus roseus]
MAKSLAYRSPIRLSDTQVEDVNHGDSAALQTGGKALVHTRNHPLHWRANCDGPRGVTRNRTSFYWAISKRGLILELLAHGVRLEGIILLEDEVSIPRATMKKARIPRAKAIQD